MSDTEYYTQVSAMEPMLPQRQLLHDLAFDLSQKSAQLNGTLASGTRAAVVRLLRLVNCYYSNLIEGHKTTLAEIERGLTKRFESNDKQRSLQLEANAHIEVQDIINHRLNNEPALNVCTTEFICFIHHEFYKRMPVDFRFVLDHNGFTRVPVGPGEIRSRQVTVGRHVAPDFEALPNFLTRFEDCYDLKKHHGGEAKILAIAASHHRLMWIHPFLDGNGRVARLFTHAMLARTILGHGLWTVSRGFARQQKEYYDFLANADSSRRNDYDGRGNLSQQGLDEFCEFFLKTCLDQVDYMGKVLSLDDLYTRVGAYADFRSTTPSLEFKPLRPEAKYILQEVCLRGAVPRGEAGRITGLGQETARRIVSQLLNEGLLVSESHKSPVRMGMPIHAIGYYFPNL